MNKDFKKAVSSAAKALIGNSHVFAAVMLLIGLVNTIVPKSMYQVIFQNNALLDSFIGGALGSILLGNPITSYIFAGEFLNSGVALVAVTAFIVAWVTVGIVQLPAESMMLGKRFAILRNISSFVLSILVALITVGVLSLI